VGWLTADLEGRGRSETDQLADEDEADAVGARRIAHVLFASVIPNACSLVISCLWLVRLGNPQARPFGS
jgi:hypothetical protein